MTYLYIYFFNGFLMNLLSRYLFIFGIFNPLYDDEKQQLI